ncbi:class I SAM-dependent methyltransferase [Egibacter rhizosphaerae]|uniref:class I SAM-dependent methyltransferase n=1 Tax=Egibacter rhizosphaerae TaxID=1670831 RepID=UPI0013F16D18|nr:class I SAM-dependent methyltransferase [Egibacter rhizosphaerae]
MSGGIARAVRSVSDAAWAAGYDLVCGHADRGEGAAHRRALVATASGVVCELGVGTGRNLSWYGGVAKVVGVDPSPATLARARRRALHAGIETELLVARAEALPLPDQSVDTVVASLVLCTVGSPAEALAEARRVLAPDGQLLFYEHVRDRDPRVAARQARLTPAWRRLARGCHLDRDALGEVVSAGFVVDALMEAPLDRAPGVLRRHLIGRVSLPT